MAKKKPQRTTSIDNTIEQLKTEQDTILKNSTEITLVEISRIKELSLENDILMHNRISYSKTKLLELAENISNLANENTGILGTGLLNPVMLRINNGVLERIHGENRIKAIKLNGTTTVPAIILENVSDELARFMRSSENLNREDLNVYDETLSILEHIQLACGFESIEKVKVFINKIKNFQAGKTTLNDIEKNLLTQVSKVFEKIGRFDIITFVDRLSVLKLNPLIKQALVDDLISYTQAKVIKSKLTTDDEIIKILEMLKHKKISANDLRKILDKLKNSTDTKNIDNRTILLNSVSKQSKSISKQKYLSLNNDEKEFVDQKLKEIEKIYYQIENKINK
ncbi:ParB/RepB/Spo0J family partition protein [Poseidonibacter lekithochrous]|uniref:ParB/RepB/Spo0J family partition protein n=1 Tax=Poseidonibacter TaxID=2321187 RepID=UPI001C09ECE8|nr:MULTISPECIES: ParB/RepB/Spo0J family partition protein [Poseidonibacter]MBU3015606.1 ParB/RepB/Spo0J family partition protein [Poseidonibacter lekithochrous]MDO6828906.1 ParB/RepB/Spo0J family partition protein [Poseidonibacter sp. 1_MG-2023]